MDFHLNFSLSYHAEMNVFPILIYFYKLFLHKQDQAYRIHILDIFNPVHLFNVIYFILSNYLQNAVYIQNG